MINKTPHVALIVETSVGSGREILRGISKYLAENVSWSIFHQPSGLNEALPSWIKKWDGDGIIDLKWNFAEANKLAAIY